MHFSLAVISVASPHPEIKIKSAALHYDNTAWGKLPLFSRGREREEITLIMEIVAENEKWRGLVSGGGPRNSIKLKYGSNDTHTHGCA